MYDLKENIDEMATRWTDKLRAGKSENALPAVMNLVSEIIVAASLRDFYGGNKEGDQVSEIQQERSEHGLD